jgi:hypothetical protein
MGVGEVVRWRALRVVMKVDWMMCGIIIVIIVVVVIVMEVHTPLAQHSTEYSYCTWYVGLCKYGAQFVKHNCHVHYWWKNGDDGTA